ncbi:MAG: phage baseplate assembly protein V [Desulfobacteraceae bacterium]|jgi:uncharacterized protein involved in type VI secretion and phage assembly
MEETVIRLARQIESKRYGKYRGAVTDNQDPEKRGRLKLRIPSVLGDQVSDWALPCVPFGGSTAVGFFAVPEVDAAVWVEFEEGDIHRPIWTGTFWQQSGDVPQDAAKDEPTTRLIQTPSGHILQFDDAAGEERFRLHHPSDAEMVIDKDGAVTLTDGSDNTVQLDAGGNTIVVEDANGNAINMTGSGVVIEDANGNKIEMAASGIKVEGEMVTIQGSMVHLGGKGGEPLIKGTTFLTLFATHIHTVAPMVGGPTSPPIPQGEMSSLSTKVMAT